MTLESAPQSRKREVDVSWLYFKLRLNVINYSNMHSWAFKDLITLHIPCINEVYWHIIIQSVYRL